MGELKEDLQIKNIPNYIAEEICKSKDNLFDQFHEDVKDIYKAPWLEMIEQYVQYRLDNNE